MLDTEIAHTSTLNKALIDRIHHRIPAFQTLRLPTNRAMKKIKIDIPQTALAERVQDSRLRGLVGHISTQFCGEEYIFPLHVRSFIDEVVDSAANFRLIEVPSSAVNGFVTSLWEADQQLCSKRKVAINTSKAYFTAFSHS